MAHILRSAVDVHKPSGDPFWGIHALSYLDDALGTVDRWDSALVHDLSLKFKAEFDASVDENAKARSARLWQVFEYWLENYKTNN